MADKRRESPRHSPFARFSMIAVSLLLLGCSAFVMMYFNTDWFYELDSERAAPSMYYQSRGVTSTIVNWENYSNGVNEVMDGDQGTAGGITGGNPSGGGNGSWDGTTLAFNAMDFYTQSTFSGVGTAIPDADVNGVSVYNGIPWQDDGNWYRLDLGAVNAYLTTNLGKPLQGGSSFHKDNYNKNSPTERDGVMCAGISWMPIFCFLSGNEDGSFSAPYTKTLCNEFYGVVELSKAGMTYYLPICSGGDNKGHLFPGGMVQTYIGNATRLDTSTGMITIDSSSNATDQKMITWNGVRAHHLSISFDEFKSSWKDAVKYGNGGMGSHPQLTIETHEYFKADLAEYSIVGFIIHKN